jgi:hypothetical protein
MTTSRTDNRELSRREFSVEALTALFAGVVITVTACDDDGSTLVVGPGGADVSGSISANHGHVATVTSVELAAGNTVALSIRGTADHPHTVTLSASEVVQIQNRQRVTATSTTDVSQAFGTHAHTVTFN